MATWIDWHSHHTSPEAVETFAEFTGKRPKIDDYDSTDFADRVQQMDEVGIDLQLICQGAGLYADQLPADQALAIVRQSNDLLAQRIAPHRQRLMGVTALSLKNIEASVEELERTSTRGFRAALLYPTVDGEMVVDLPVMDPLYAKIAELGWPIFLHGAGLAKEPNAQTARRWRSRGRVRRPFRRRDIGVRVAHDRQRRFRSLSGFANCHSQLRRRPPACSASLFLET